MKNVFVKTSNVQKFTAAVTRLQNRETNVPGMALLYGKYGLGRTETAIWWAGQKVNVKFIRAVALISGRWLLSEIVSELGEAPRHRTQHLFEQCYELLIGRPMLLIFDEIDYMVHDARVIETLRDLHDITGTAIILIGMEHTDKKLMRYRHLYDRFSEIIHFDDLTEADIRMIVNEMCDVKLGDDAINFLYKHKGINRFRPLIIELYRAESIAKTNNLTEVTAEHFGGSKR